MKLRLLIVLFFIITGAYGVTLSSSFEPDRTVNILARNYGISFGKNNYDNFSVYKPVIFIPHSYSGRRGPTPLIVWVIAFIPLTLILLFIFYLIVSQPVHDFFKARSKKKILEKEYDNIKKIDPRFNGLDFLNFVNSLYIRFYYYHGTTKLNRLFPFIPAEEIKEGNQKNIKITEIVIKKTEIKEIVKTGDLPVIIVEFDADYTEISVNGDSVNFSVTESWEFSPLENGKLNLNCLDCGAKIIDFYECENCNSVIKEKMNWGMKSRWFY
jgi:hypothetical protein